MFGITDDTKQMTIDIGKLASAWAAVGITSWADFASFVAAVYTLVLLSEWVWKRAIRPLLERCGGLPPKPALQEPYGKGQS